MVKATSVDFNSLTALIEETERAAEDNISEIRRVYDAFLAEFPLCCAYWKKYAEHEFRLGYIEKVVEVFERGVEAVTYSVDMWLHYCQFAISMDWDPEIVRRLFERGLVYVGTDYLSYSLWDKYIDYENSLQQWRRLAVIFTRILESPNQQLDNYFNRFKELAGNQPLAELQTAEEAAVVAGTKFKTEEELEKYVSVREAKYKKAKESKITGFLTAIGRTYFHVECLRGAELENWHNYLDFIESGNDIDQIVKVYERCLIACANYYEYWIRYVLCMEANGKMDLANNALTRATQIFVKRRPEIHMFCARFKEQNGDIAGARASYELLHSGLFPGLLEAIIKHANMEYRLGNLEKVCSLYDKAIETEIRKDQSQTLPMLVIQYARFQDLVARDPKKAREILDGALGHVQLSKPFLEALIHRESIQLGTKRIAHLDAIVEKFIMPISDDPNASSITDREDLSSTYLEFLDQFGDIQTIKKANFRHTKLFSRHKRASELEKQVPREQGQQHPKGWMYLPNDIFSGISARLDVPTAVRCLFVCNEWKKNLKEFFSLDRDEIDLSSADTEISGVALRCLLSTGVGAKRIILGEIDTDIWILLSERLNWFREFFCNDTSGLTPEVIGTLVGILADSTRIELLRWEYRNPESEIATIMWRVEIWARRHEEDSLVDARVNNISIVENLNWHNVYQVAENVLLGQQPNFLSLIIEANPGHRFKAVRVMDTYSEENY